MYPPPEPCLGGLLLGGVTGGLPGSGPPATPLTCPAGVEVRSVSAPWRAAEEGNSMLRRLGIGVGLVGGGTGSGGGSSRILRCNSGRGRIGDPWFPPGLLQ